MERFWSKHEKLTAQKVIDMTLLENQECAGVVLVKMSQTEKAINGVSPNLAGHLIWVQA